MCHQLNEADYDGRTAMHLAAAEGHEKTVRFLLSRGARADCQDRWGGTPLDDAKREGHKDLTEFLKAVIKDPDILAQTKH